MAIAARVFVSMCDPGGKSHLMKLSEAADFSCEHLCSGCGSSTGRDHEFTSPLWTKDTRPLRPPKTKYKSFKCNLERQQAAWIDSRTDRRRQSV